MSSPPTILFQPLNHIGLGHVNRLASIALALRRLDPCIRTLFVVEGGAHVLLDSLGLPYLPLPSEHAMHETDSWSSWTASERSSFSSQISRAILGTVLPQIVVFDCVPNPAFAAATFEAALPAVLCLREMRDLDAYLAFMRESLPHLNLILVPHDPGAFDLPEPLREKAHFVGEIARPFAPAPAGHRNPACPRIGISGGGGGYPGTIDFYNLATAAISKLRAEYPTCEVRLIAGPLFRDWDRLSLQTGLRVIPFESDMPAVFASADLVICQAGYNTIAEIQQVGTKAILVPAERLWDNQFARADRASRLHPHIRVLRSADPAALAHLASQLLREPDPARALEVARPPGAARAAALLHALLLPQQSSPK